MNRIFNTLVFTVFFNVFSYSQADKVVGYWITEEGDSQIQIFKAGNGKYYGNITWLKNQKDSKDDMNPNPGLRSQKIMGLQILKGFVWSAEENDWQNGTIYDPRNGSTYDCYMWFDKDYNKLKIKGYILGVRFLGRETTWIRESIIRS
jgi:uncharacterized protein (DUF2147 family)